MRPSNTAAAAAANILELGAASASTEGPPGPAMEGEDEDRPYPAASDEAGFARTPRSGGQ